MGRTKNKECVKLYIPEIQYKHRGCVIPMGCVHMTNIYKLKPMGCVYMTNIYKLNPMGCVYMTNINKLSLPIKAVYPGYLSVT